ncbi:MAG: U32 family peptidase [Candidatus Izemoplasmatales bacterium]|jgi:putative protease|nr:U32 family peptidase [Candidatus Izemoplasmatales bacterium]
MRTELLAPAGSLEKAKIALLYGADAVYIGGKQFSLRARASNFDLDTIKELVDFAHDLKKKVYVTMNIVFHDDDTIGLDDYLRYLDSIKVDAIICSSMIVVERAKAITNLEIHLSTQFSLTNSYLANYFYDEGIKRVVLARELSLEEIKLVQEKSEADLEVFIHGGMCVSYSGRCTLSNYTSLRDANRGGCAHTCRWLYNLYEDHELLSNDYDFQMSSKDLDATEFVKDLLEIGISSLKIEGRMKSIHYIATVVSAYRMLIDDYYSGHMKELKFYQDEIKKAENRQTSHGFFKGDTTIEEQLYNQRSEIPTKEFVGMVIGYDKDNKQLMIEQRNFFSPGDTLEIFTPDKNTVQFKVDKILSKELEELDAARHPLQKLLLNFNIEVPKYSMIRKVSYE